MDGRKTGHGKDPKTRKKSARSEFAVIMMYPRALLVSVLLLLLATPASGLRVSIASRVSGFVADRGLAAATAASPFALSQSFDVRAFSPSAEPTARTCATLVWPLQAEKLIADLCDAPSLESFGVALLARVRTSDGFRLVAGGSEQALRAFVAATASRGCDPIVVWS